MAHPLTMQGVRRQLARRGLGRGRVAVLGLVVQLLLCVARLARADEPVATAQDATPTDPFAFDDFTWVPGNGRTTTLPLQTQYFTGEFRVDTAFHYSLHRPQDDTLTGSSNAFRHGELQLTQLGIGGDFHVGPAHGRLMTQLGMYAQTTPETDGSVGRGQWNIATAYRYLSEAWGGWHFDQWHGINVQAGLFTSFLGLYSYYNADNWTYQPSFISSNTPWFFNGLRVQAFPTDRLKVELWLVNGWQSYGRYADAPGIGGQVLWRPSGNLSFVASLYGGADTLGVPDRKRWHSDNSAMWKYRDQPGSIVSKAAISLTVDAGCETGGGVTCGSQYVLGAMAYHRLWLAGDRFAATIGGGVFRNPGRYTVILPPINGANAVTGSAYFSTAPGMPFTAWDGQIAADWMPSQHAMLRLEFVHREADVSYFAGPGGITPPGGNTGSPDVLVPGWKPDLRTHENRLLIAWLLKI